MTIRIVSSKLHRLLVGALFAGISVSGFAQADDPATFFIENLGQREAYVDYEVIEPGGYRVRVIDHGLEVMPDARSRNAGMDSIKVAFHNAERAAFSGRQVIDGAVLFWFSQDIDQPVAGARRFASLGLDALYPGIAARYETRPGEFVRQLDVAPGADLRPVEIRYRAGQAPELLADGSILVGDALERAPVARLASGRLVPLRFVARDRNTFGIEAPDSLDAQRFTIELTLEFSDWLPSQPAPLARLADHPNLLEQVEAARPGDLLVFETGKRAIAPEPQEQVSAPPATSASTRATFVGGDMGCTSLVLNNGDVIDPTTPFTNVAGFVVRPGATVSVLGGAGAPLDVTAAGILVQGTLRASGVGEPGGASVTGPNANGITGSGLGPGVGGTQAGFFDEQSGGGGGAYGGNGGRGGVDYTSPAPAPGGTAYGTALPPGIEFGSGGGSGAAVGAVPSGAGGAGGGIVDLLANDIRIVGTVAADGFGGGPGNQGGDESSAGGGGAGGGVVIESSRNTLGNGTILARGGPGGGGTFFGGTGGGGAGGRIKFAGALDPSAAFVLAVGGGGADTSNYIPAAGGAAGTADQSTTGAPNPGGADVTTCAVTITERLISQVDSADPVVAGTALTYTVTVINDGPGPETNAVVTTTLDPNVTLASTSGCAEDPAGAPTCTLGALAPGASTSYSVTVNVPSNYVGALSNAVAVSGDNVDPVPVNDQATEPTGVVAEADLAVSKVDNVDPVVAGTNVTYTVNVDNLGPSDATNVVVTESLPAGFTLVSTTGCAEDPTGAPTCSLGTITTGGSASYTVTAAVDPSVLGTVTNTVSVTSDATDPVAGNNSFGENTTVVAESDLSIAKTDSPDPVAAGTSLTYTIIVDNAGPSDATGVAVSDTLPAGLTLVSTSGCAEDPGGAPTCTLGTIPAGGQASYTITAAVGSGVVGIVSNTASVSSNATDPNGGNDSATADTQVIAEADMAITKNGPATALAGTQVTYGITVTNNGPSDAQSVSVADPTPAGYTIASVTAPCGGGFPCALSTVAAGVNVAFSVTYDIDPATSGDVTNTASVSSSTTDPAAGNESASATTTVNSEADMAITKAGPATAVAGTQVTYDITVTNNGPSDAQAVSVADPTPTGYTFASATAPCGGGFPCALGTVAASDNVAFSVTFDIDTATSGDVTNTASVSTSTTDPNAGNDSASATTTMNSEADLTIDKTAGSNTVQLGENVVYTIVVSNAGPSDATNVVVTDNLPAGQELVSTSGCAEDPIGAPACSLGMLQSGTSASYTLTATVIQPSVVPPVNTASVTSDAADPNGADNSSTAGFTVAFRIPTLGLLGLISLALMVTLVGGFQLRRLV